MKVSIVRAAILFQLCQLIKCIHVHSCEEQCPVCTNCIVTVPSLPDQLEVDCRHHKLEIRKLDPESASPKNDNYTDFPSVTDLWQVCLNNEPRQRPKNSTFLIRVRIKLTRITYPDYYFCNQPHMTTVDISNNLLNDSRKLGFSSSANCDSPCSAKVEELHASSNYFQKVFNNSFCGLEHLTHLDMSSSWISELESDAFVNLKSLHTLKLYENHISVISPGVFRGQENTLEWLIFNDNLLNSESLRAIKCLHKLESIDLRGNMVDVFPEGMFDRMTQLEVLLMSNNLFERLPRSLIKSRNLKVILFDQNNISVIYHEDLKGMVNLKEINLSDNPISTVEPGAFTNISNVKIVKISKASLSELPNFIAKMVKLKNLYLSHNRIDRIDVGAFDGNADIHSIDLSHNKLTDITNVFANCTVKYLAFIHNQLTKLSFTDFGSNLIGLDLSSNHIHTIESRVDGNDVAMISDRWTLQSLRLSDNRLNELRNLSLPRSLTMFDVQNNNISYISYSSSYINLTYSGLCKLNRMYLQNNAFEIICRGFILDKSETRLQYYFGENPLLCSCEHDWLSRTTNIYGDGALIQNMIADRNWLTCKAIFQRIGNHNLSIGQLEKNDFLCVSNSTCYCNKHLDDQSQCLPVDCPQQCMCYSNDRYNIIDIDCSSKKILTLPVTQGFILPRSTRLKVYLDNNSIYHINSSSFIGLHNTIFLYLNQTGLTEMEDGSFDHLEDLKILHLDQNSLRHISEKIFKRLSSLTQLFLSHNQIQTVASNAFPSQLQILHLDNNQLVDYSIWQLENLTHLMKLSLHGNKWSCECNYIEKFRNWLQKYSAIVEATNHLFCFHSNGTQLRMPIITFNSSYCYNTTSINISLYNYDNMWKWLLGVFICLTIAAVLAFVFRREVQVLIYSRMGVRLFYSGEKDELEGKYFDAFIAYSCVDEDFLVNTLMPGLEHIDEPYKLCLHHRNFLGGASIINSIMEAVQFSTRTIILLSDNFMRSEWCRFEFQQAYIQMLKDRCNRLLVIVIDEVPADLDPEMRVYLRTNTYLKWGDRLFWKKLYFAMPERVEPRLVHRRLAQQRLAQPQVPHEDINPET